MRVTTIVGATALLASVAIVGGQQGIPGGSWSQWIPAGGGNQAWKGFNWGQYGVPGNIQQWFQNGQLSWLTPNTYQFLQGGRFDRGSGQYYLQNGTPIGFGTPQWSQYFGNLNPQQLAAFFPGSGYFNQAFNFSPQFLSQWQGGGGGGQGNPWYTGFNWGQYGIPQNIAGWFQNGQLSWLTPSTYQFLQGGRFDLASGQYFLQNGTPIRFGTPQWSQYFGNLAPQQLAGYFPGNGYFNQAFNFSPQFLDQWKLNFNGGGQGNPWYTGFNWGQYGIPQNIVNWFQNGQLSWLTPSTYQFLQGGRFDSASGQYYLQNGVPVRFGTPQWAQYFGNLTPQQLGGFFPGSGYFNQIYNFSPQFLDQWKFNFNGGGGGGQNPWYTGFNWGQYGIPQNIANWFQNGQLSWLTPSTYQFLQGGRFDLGSGQYYLQNGTPIRFGTPQWTQYFGNLTPQQLAGFFPGNGYFNQVFNFSPQFLDQWKVYVPQPGGGGIPWVQFPSGFNWGQFGVPQNVASWFQNGQLNWLTPYTFQFLQGGRFDPGSGQYFLQNGTPIRFGTPEWIQCFGNLTPQQLAGFFPGNGNFNDIFKFSPQFWDQWKSFFPGTWTTPGNNWGQIFNQFKVPPQYINWFNNGQLNWLNPTTYQFLQGARWNPSTLQWTLPNGSSFGFGSPEWTKYFGNLTPQQFNVFFPNGGDFNQVFSFLNPQFFQLWNGWQPQQPNFNWVYQQYKVPQQFVNWFDNGQLNWLNPTTYQFLQGATWNPSSLQWTLPNGVSFGFGSPQWTQYFGNLSPDVFNLFFPPNGGSFNGAFSFLTPDFFQNWTWWQQNPPPVIPTTPPPVTQPPTPPPVITQPPTPPPVVTQPPTPPPVVTQPPTPPPVVTQPPTPPPVVTQPPTPPPVVTQPPTPPPVVTQPPTPPPVVTEPPTNPNVPQVFIGRLDWLTPYRFQLLQGGRWDFNNGYYITRDGQIIRPGSGDWVTYFGSLTPQDLAFFFQKQPSFDQAFYFVGPQYWTVHTIVIPGQFVYYYNQGLIDWLTPSTYQVLQGGRWEPSSSSYILRDGSSISPGSANWQQYFGNTSPQQFGQLFQQSNSFEDVFGFFQSVQGFSAWFSQKPPKQPVQTSTIVIPGQFGYWYNQGLLDWLTPASFQYLQGGSWNPSSNSFVTSGGNTLSPGSASWQQYFGNASAQQIAQFFQQSNSFNDVFGFFQSPQVFYAWYSQKPPKQPVQTGGGTIVIPGQFGYWYNQGLVDWLTPASFQYLQGGSWSPSSNSFVTSGGNTLSPGSASWQQYFGNASAQQIAQFFQQSNSFNDVFGFFQSVQGFSAWYSQKPPKQPVQPPQPSGGGSVSFSFPADPAVGNLFRSGQMNWLSLERIRQLQGGSWNGSSYVLANGSSVSPGSSQWSQLFGNFSAQNLNVLFQGTGAWNAKLGFLNEIIKQIPAGATLTGFQWSQLAPSQSG